MSYPPMGAPNPLIVVPKGLANSWKELATTSFLAAEEPVTIAMWPAAVSEGDTDRFCLA